MNITRLFDLTCRKATFLASKKEEGRLTLRERILLSLHLKTCEPCRRFISQSKIITQSLRKYGGSPMNAAERLSEEKKQAIQKEIEERMGKQE